MSLNVKEIPVGAVGHPPPQNDILPIHEFSMGLIAPKGSGKTTLLANLVKFYSKYFHTILVFSPTVKSDEKWDWVKKQKVIEDNTPLKKWLKNKNEEEEKTPSAVDRQSNPTNPEHAPLLDFTIPEGNFYEEYDEDTLQAIMDEQMDLIRALKDAGKTKHLANRIMIIFDDLVGSSLFSNKKKNPFKILNTTHRHYSISMLMVTQAYKEIPKTVRTNFSALILFEIPNEKELEVIYEENPVGLSHDDWMKFYNYSTAGDHDFMFINYQKPKNQRITKNFTHILYKK